MDLSPAEHLDRLAKAFAEAGWSSRPRYEAIPPELRVFHAEWPQYGDTLTVTIGLGGELWFASSTGAPLAHVSDLAGAVKGFETVMEEMRADVERLSRRGPMRRRCRWWWRRLLGGGAR